MRTRDATEKFLVMKLENETRLQSTVKHPEQAGFPNLPPDQFDLYTGSLTLFGLLHTEIYSGCAYGAARSAVLLTEKKFR